MGFQQRSIVSDRLETMPTRISRRAILTVVVCTGVAMYVWWPAITRMFDAQPDIMYTIMLTSAAFALAYWLLWRDCLALSMRTTRSCAELEQLTVMLAEAQGQLELTQSQVHAALKAVEAQHAKLNEIDRTRTRAAQPRWEIAGEVLHGLEHELSLRNIGAPAADARAQWPEPSRVTILLSNVTLIGSGECIGIKIVFHDRRIPQFKFKLHYLDAIGEPRALVIRISEIPSALIPLEC